MALVNKFPEIKIPNRFFKNNGNLVFTDLNYRVNKDKTSYSNGAVYADFDNDGDLDIVVNNTRGEFTGRVEEIGDGVYRVWVRIGPRIRVFRVDVRSGSMQEDGG